MFFRKDSFEQLDKNPRSYGDYNYVYFFMMLFITIFIVCDTTAFRMANFFGTSVPTSGLIIPVVFALGDLIAEVYGYQVSRKLIWNNLVCQFIFGIVITLALTLPSPSGDTFNAHYSETFKHIIRTNITSCMSVTSGMFTNAFLMSKMKIWMNGKRFWIRTILSSSISEFVLCFVAYTTLYAGLKNFSTIWHIIVTVWYYKLIFAFCIAPIVSILSVLVKRLENSDVYDYGMNYNPFLYNYKNTIAEGDNVSENDFSLLK
jgi:queuosine precursor transporter